MATQRVRLTAATAAVTNQFVTSTNMANGAYSIANGGLPSTAGARLVVATITGVTGNDTPGTITIVGTGAAGQAQTEVLTLVAGGTATSTGAFKSITSITQAGWVINGGNDTIIIGQGASAYVCDKSGRLNEVFIGTTAAGTITLTDAAGVIAVFKASIVENGYLFNAEFAGFLKVDVAAASDVTIFASQYGS